MAVFLVVLYQNHKVIWTTASGCARILEATMYGGNQQGNDELQRLRAHVAQLQREHGQAMGMVQILQGKLAEAEEDNFDLRANMAAIEAESAFQSNKKAEQMQNQVASLESRLSFQTEQLKNAERAKLRAIREFEELRQKQLLEQKRLDAEKRLLATKKRKHETALYAASQSMYQRMSQVEHVSTETSRQVSTASSAIQTDPPIAKEKLAAENTVLVAKLMRTSSRDLLVLFKGTSETSDEMVVQEEQHEDGSQHTAPTAFGATPSQQGDGSSTIGFSQSVFSQIAGQAHAQVKASLLNFAKEVNSTQASYVNERAKDLHDALGVMIQGDSSALALAPILIQYLAAPTDLDTTVLCSVLRILYLVIVSSDCFQEFLLLASSASSLSADDSARKQAPSSTRMEHPRITLPGLHYTSLDDYLASRKDDSSTNPEAVSSQEQERELADRMQMRSKLMSALCRVIKNNVNDPNVVEYGLSILMLWVDLGASRRAMHTDFRALVASNVIQDVAFAPKAIVKLKARALSLLLQLVQFHETFPEIEALAKRTLIFNRCAKMLSTASTHPHVHKAHEDEPGVIRELQRVVIRLLLAIVVSYPSSGVRFVLESTKGLPNDDDRELSVIYHLSQLLHRETFDARTLGYDALDILLQDKARMGLVQDAFTLLSLLVRYVNLSRELGSPHHEFTFLSVLYLLSSGKFDLPKNNTISKTAAALVRLMQ